MVEVSSLMSRVASQNNKDGEIDLETFESLIVNYLRSQRNTLSTDSNQKLENLAIYVTDKNGLLVLDSRGLTLGKDMRAHDEVDSALSGGQGITRVIVENVPGPKKLEELLLNTFTSQGFLTLQIQFMEIMVKF